MRWEGVSGGSRQEARGWVEVCGVSRGAGRAHAGHDTAQWETEGGFEMRE